MKLALYGGTFDPIHHGHLILAREAREQLGLDRVVLVPAARSPFKPGVAQTPPEVRLAMVAAAVEGEPGLAVDDSEITRGGTSYTIDTVLAARARWPEAELWWLVGADHVAELPRWHRYAELRELVRFAVLARAGSGAAAAHGLPVVARTIDISATEVRARVARGASIRYLTPPAVAALIARHGLYTTKP
jgi:nicotinate-nucleotide adenylyltransferase